MNRGGFSCKRFVGLSAEKNRISKAIGIPLTRTGRQRKSGAGLGCMTLGQVIGDRPERSLAIPFHAKECWLACASCYRLRGSALPTFLLGISSRRHFRTRKQAFHRHCTNPSLPVQPQSRLSGFAFILFVLGLSVWLNNAWLPVTLVLAVGGIAMIVIPREERFLDRNLPDQYSSYKAAVRRRF